MQWCQAWSVQTAPSCCHQTLVVLPPKFCCLARCRPGQAALRHRPSQAAGASRKKHAASCQASGPCSSGSTQQHGQGERRRWRQAAVAHARPAGAHEEVTATSCVCDPRMRPSDDLCVALKGIPCKLLRLCFGPSSLRRRHKALQPRSQSCQARPLPCCGCCLAPLAAAILAGCSHLRRPAAQLQRRVQQLQVHCRHGGGPAVGAAEAQLRARQAVHQLLGLQESATPCREIWLCSMGLVEVLQASVWLSIRIDR